VTKRRGGSFRKFEMWGNAGDVYQIDVGWVWLKVGGVKLREDILKREEKGKKTPRPFSIGFVGWLTDGRVKIGKVRRGKSAEKEKALGTTWLNLLGFTNRVPRFRLKTNHGNQGNRGRS